MWLARLPSSSNETASGLDLVISRKRRHRVRSRAFSARVTPDQVTGRPWREPPVRCARRSVFTADWKPGTSIACSGNGVSPVRRSRRWSSDLRTTAIAGTGREGAGATCAVVDGRRRRVSERIARRLKQRPHGRLPASLPVLNFTHDTGDARKKRAKCESGRRQRWQMPEPFDQPIRPDPSWAWAADERLNGGRRPRRRCRPSPVACRSAGSTTSMGGLNRRRSTGRRTASRAGRASVACRGRDALRRRRWLRPTRRPRRRGAALWTVPGLFRPCASALAKTSRRAGESVPPLSAADGTRADEASRRMAGLSLRRAGDAGVPLKRWLAIST